MFCLNKIRQLNIFEYELFSVLSLILMQIFHISTTVLLKIYYFDFKSPNLALSKYKKEYFNLSLAKVYFLQKFAVLSGYYF